MDNEKLLEIADAIEKDAQEPEAASARIEQKLGLEKEHTRGLITTLVSFVKSFKQNFADYEARHPGDPQQAQAAWLEDQFEKEGCGKDAAERKETARGIAQTLASYEQAKKDLARHLEEGGTRASWLKTRIEEGAEVNGYESAEQYAREIAEGLDEANREIGELRFGLAETETKEARQ